MTYFCAIRKFLFLKINAITGQITVTSAGAEVKIRVFEDVVSEDTAISQEVSSRAGKTIPYNLITIDPSGHEDAEEIYKDIIIQIKNESNKELGVFFANENISESDYNEDGTIKESGIQIDPIILTDKVGEDNVNFAKVFVQYYSHIMPKGSSVGEGENEIATDVVEMYIRIHLQEFQEVSNFIEWNRS